jgi:hypothetical protein
MNETILIMLILEKKLCLCLIKYKQVIIAGELDQIGASEASRKGIVKNWLVVQNIAKSHLRKRKNFKPSDEG